MAFLTLTHGNLIPAPGGLSSTPSLVPAQNFNWLPGGAIINFVCLIATVAEASLDAAIVVAGAFADVAEASLSASSRQAETSAAVASSFLKTKVRDC